MSNRSPNLLLEDVLESANKILQYVNNLSYEQFIQDPKTCDAVIRNFEIIGEAANRLSEDFKVKNKDVDWKRIKGFRNRIVHDYFGVDYSIVWQIIQHYLPSLIKTIRDAKD